MAFLEELMNNVYVWLILAICTVIGLPSFIYTLASRKRKELSYSIESHVLVKSSSTSVPNLKLLFDNQEIDNLTTTIITVWNSGNVAIKKEDIVDTKPVAVYASSPATILDAKVIKQNEVSNSFSIKKTDDSAIIDFKYVDKYEGAVFQIFHTGRSQDLTFKCKVIGGKGPIARDSAQDEKRTLKANLLSSVLSAVTGVSVSITTTLGTAISSSEVTPSRYLILVISMVCIFLLADLVLSKQIKRVFHIGIPENLK